MKRTFSPGNKAGLLILIALLIFSLAATPALAMKKQVAENPLLYQGMGKVAVNDQVICNAGTVENLISNSTSEFATGTNDWTIIIGDDSAEQPSMIWKTPGIYADINHYLYFASLRLGYNGHLIRLAQDRATNITVRRLGQDANALSLFDTEFFISDTSAFVPTQYRVGVGVRQKTYAWSEAYRDDFIIYDWWIYNFTDAPLEPFWAGLHADCDVSTAEGGTGTQAWSRDDLVGYVRDSLSGEYISYMYDGDNPTVPGNDTGGRLSPKESAGYIGSRLLYCPPAIGDTEPSVQKGSGWWDWNSDPSDDNAAAEWFDHLSDGLWLDPPPSPHDYRFYQKFGPFSIPAMDSIRVMVAFGIGEGLAGLKANLEWAKLLFDNNWVGPSSPNAPQYTVTPGDGEVTITWDTGAESSVDPLTGEQDFEGYRLWKKTKTGWSLLMECDLINDIGFNTGLVHSYVDYDVHNGFQYTYTVTSYDKGDLVNNIESLESGLGSGSAVQPGIYSETADANVTGIHVYPNPFVAQSAPDFGFTPDQNNPATERIVFVNLEPSSTIRIYTMTGDLITTIKNAESNDQWEKVAAWDLITDNKQTIVSGLYIYVVETPGQDDFIGKFAVIR